MANLVEVNMDLFKSKLIGREGCMITHCISADYVLGAGFALQIENRYHIRDRLKGIGTYNYTDCIAIGGILNIVTKGAYWTKPTYETFEKALIITKEYCIENDISILIMPRTGCGLDILNWKVCNGIIQNILVDNGIDCVVYKLKQINQ